MIDKTDSKEREAFERALMDLAAQDGDTVSTSDLSRDTSGAYDNEMAEIAWMLWQARASLAASAGSEPVATDMVAVCSEDANRYCIILRLLGMEEEGDPVAEVQRLQDLAANLQGKQHGWLYDWTHSSATGRPDESFTGFTEDENHARSGTGHRNIRAVYTHPSPPVGMVGGWTALPGALPEPGVPVLLDIGKKYPIRAMWAAKHTVEAADDDTDWGEYDEATDTYYCPEGWYEWNQCEDNHWRVTETPRAWAPLPPTSSADSRKGE